MSLDIRLMAAIILLLALTGCESSLMRQVAYHEKTRDYGAAVSVLESAIAADPSNPEALYLLGRVHFNEQEYEKGLPQLDKAVALSSRYESEISYLKATHLNEAVKLGNSALQEEDWTLAAEQFAFATEISPDDVRMWLALGSAFLADDKLTEAENAFASALQRDPESAEALLNSAEIKLREKDYEAAILPAERVLALYPEEHGDLANVKLFYARLALNDIEGANRAYGALTFSQVLERHNHAVANYNAQIFDEAESTLARLKGLPEDKRRAGEYSMLLGEILLQEQRWDEAAALYKQVVISYPRDQDARMNLIMAYDLIGFEAEAKAERKLLQSWREKGTRDDS